MKGQPLSEETKAKMKAGREAAAVRKKAEREVVDAGGHMDASPGYVDSDYDQYVDTLGKNVEPAPYDLFLASLDDETKSLLNDAELRAIFAASEKKAQDEKREALRKKAAEKALHRAKVDAGLLPKETVEQIAWRARMDELVTFTPELPTDNDGRIGDAGLRIDGRMFRHGMSVTVTRAQYMTFRDICWRAKQAEMDFEGKGRLHHLRQLAQSLDQQI